MEKPPKVERKGSKAGRSGSKVERASSLKHAAGILGVAPGVLKALKKSGSRAFDSHNRVNLDLLRKEMAERGEVGTDSKESAELEKLRLQCREIRIRTESAEGKFLPKEGAIAALGEVSGQQAQLLRQKLENEFPKRSAERSMGRMLEIAIGAGANREKALELLKLALPAATAEAKGDAKGLVDELCSMMQGLAKVWGNLKVE